MSRIMSVQHLKQAVAFVASFSMSLPVVGDGTSGKEQQQQQQRRRRTAAGFWKLCAAQPAGRRQAGLLDFHSLHLVIVKLRFGMYSL